MAWNGIVDFGFNSDGYGDYNDGMTVEISSTTTDSLDDTLDLLRKMANEYCAEEVAKGWCMPYDWNWGDVFSEIPDEVFTRYGITANAGRSDIVPHDEIVVAQILS